MRLTVDFSRTTGTGFTIISANRGKLIETSRWAAEKSLVSYSFTPGGMLLRVRVTQRSIPPGVNE